MMDLQDAVNAMVEQLNRHTYGEGGEVPQFVSELVDDLRIATGPDFDADDEPELAEAVAEIRAASNVDLRLAAALAWDLVAHRAA